MGYGFAAGRLESNLVLSWRLQASAEGQKKLPALIIDEVHLLSRQMFEAIRFLTKVRMDSYSDLGWPDKAFGNLAEAITSCNISERQHHTAPAVFQHARNGPVHRAQREELQS